MNTLFTELRKRDSSYEIVGDTIVYNKDRTIHIHKYSRGFEGKIFFKINRGAICHYTGLKTPGIIHKRVIELYTEYNCDEKRVTKELLPGDRFKPVWARGGVINLYKLKEDYVRKVKNYRFPIERGYTRVDIDVVESALTNLLTWRALPFPKMENSVSILEVTHSPTEEGIREQLRRFYSLSNSWFNKIVKTNSALAITLGLEIVYSFSLWLKTQFEDYLNEHFKKKYPQSLPEMDYDQKQKAGITEIFRGSILDFQVKSYALTFPPEFDGSLKLVQPFYDVGFRGLGYLTRCCLSKTFDKEIAIYPLDFPRDPSLLQYKERTVPCTILAVQPYKYPRSKYPIKNEYEPPVINGLQRVQEEINSLNYQIPSSWIEGEYKVGNISDPFEENVKVSYVSLDALKDFECWDRKITYTEKENLEIMDLIHLFQLRTKGRDYCRINQKYRLPRPSLRNLN